MHEQSDQLRGRLYEYDQHLHADANDGSKSTLYSSNAKGPGPR
jgi:hypothetical protein